MNKTLKFIGLLAILPLALMALTPDLIADADAARNDANVNNADDQNETHEVKYNPRSAAVSDGTINEERDTSAKNLAKGQ